MEYAIVEASGRQHWVEVGRFLDLNNTKGRLGSIISIKRILAFRDNGSFLIGTPYLKLIEINGIIGKHFLGPKLLVYKMKPKKKYRRKNGHRQNLTRLIINTIKL